MRRLTILLATVGALLLVPAASALAFTPGTMHVNIAGTGSGEVSGKGGYGMLGGAEGLWEGTPPIACKGPPATGQCTSVMEDYEELEAYGVVALQAIPALGSEFTGWTIEEGEVEFGCTTEQDENTGVYFCLVYTEGEVDGKVTANFATVSPPSLAVNIEEGLGSVVSNPTGIQCPSACTTNFEENKKILLTASPAPGYAFKSWKGCDTGGANGCQCTVTVTGAKTVGAKFYKVWKLTGKKSGGQGIFSTSPGGVNCGYACSESTALYKEGSLILKAKPAKNFHFVEFKGGTGSAASCNGVKALECTIATFNSDSSIEEVYAENATNTLSLLKEGGGQGFVKTKPTNINCGYTCTSAKAKFYASEEAEITVTLNKGTNSVTWVGGAGTCTGKVLTCKVPMSSSNGLTAKFD